MPDRTLPTPTSPAVSAANPPRHLLQEYETQQALLNAQPALVQRFLEAQARKLSEAIAQRERVPQIRFTLPDQVVTDVTSKQSQPVPPEFREQLAGGLIDRLTRADLGAALRQRLAELDQSPNRSITVSAGLLRHATALHMVRGMLPAGRSVTYAAAEGEEIPTIPTASELEPESAITATTDAIVEEGQADAGRGELLVPYVPAAAVAARRLPCLPSVRGSRPGRGQ